MKMETVATKKKEKHIHFSFLSKQKKEEPF